MKRIRLLLLTLLLSTGAALADTTETLSGRLEPGPAGGLLLTLDLPVSRLASLADKTGQLDNVELPSLLDLIRERFHYLLRLRVAEHEIAPTSLALVAPPATSPVPEFLALTATWAGIADPRAQVVTQTDVPHFRIVLSLVDRRGTAPQPPAPPILDPSGAGPWWPAMRRAAGLGFTRIVPGGLEQILFVLGLCFAARRGRDLFRQLAAFTLAHSLTLALATAGIVALTEAGLHWVQTGIALSIVAVAATACLRRENPGHAWTALVAAFGFLHGLALAAALSPALRPGERFWTSFAAALSGIELRQLVVVGLALVFAVVCRWRRWTEPLFQPGIAIPASVVIGIGGLALTFERLRSTLTFSP